MRRVREAGDLPREYAAKSFPFVPMTRRLEIEWVPGRDLYSGEEVPVPAPLVHLHYRRPPHTGMHLNAGIADGASAARAERSALLEVPERDAVTLWWMSGRPRPASGHGPSTLTSPSWICR
ncbi:YcaO-like family protein [Nonomuraea sp. NPDC050394]|uniref:YcaO-like family protein n=1 Tax=Nonomuraea sp. NPDC050394 TaxID=3364363 RepID=UPI0037946640